MPRMLELCVCLAGASMGSKIIVAGGGTELLRDSSVQKETSTALTTPTCKSQTVLRETQEK